MSNLIINTGSAATIATDLVGTINYQVVKVAFGSAGSAANLGTSLPTVGTAHPARMQAYVVATTSAAGGVVVVTSGANTIYITDITIATPGGLNVQLSSETTGLATVYLAANGGWVQDYTQPLVCNSGQSLRVILSSSGICAVTVIGYTA